MNERGATLIEVLVTVALLSVAVLAASSLIVQSVRVFEASGRSMSDPTAVLAGAWMRRDIHSARSVQVTTGGWSSERLELNGADAEVIVYEQRGARLVRSRFAQDGSEVDSRTVLQGVLDWRWRAALPRMVEIELLLPSHTDPMIAAGVTDHERLGEVSQRREAFLFGLRGGGGTSW